MDPQEFTSRVERDPALQRPFISAQKELEPETRFGATELIAVGLLYPVVLYVFKRIGLPWLNGIVHLSDAHLAKFHEYVRTKYEPDGFDPKRMEAAADALYTELTNVKSPIDQKLWEGLCKEVLAKASHNDL